MKKRVIIMLIIILAILLVLFGRWIYQRIQVSYDEDGKSVSMIGGADGPTSIFIAGKVGGGEEGMAEYTSIDMETAKSIFETEGDYIILDVRTIAEYNRHNRILKLTDICKCYRSIAVLSIEQIIKRACVFFGDFRRYTAR